MKEGLDCPLCGAAMSDLVKVEGPTESVAVTGRRVLTWTATSKENVAWDPKRKLYRCGKCGKDFTFQQGVAGNKEDP